jgi:alanine racemase
MTEKAKFLRPTYANIYLDNYLFNLKKAIELSNSGIIPIVKANGYGHGANELSEYALNNLGIKKFGVATVEEGISLRKHLGNIPDIYILGYVDCKFYEEILENNLILTLFDEQYAKSFHKYIYNKNKRVEVSIKIDTGMNRLGFFVDLNLNDFLIKYKNFKLDMIMSHLSSSDTDVDCTENQIDKFKNFLRRTNVNCISSMFNSSGICNFKNIFNLTRPGIMTYGYVFSFKDIGLKPVMKIYSKIVQIKKIAKGDGVSYNKTFKADSERIIGIMPVGYADGYLRCFSNKAEMFLNGYNVKVIGNVCMDMCMIDITDVPERFYGEKVELLGDNIDADKWAKWADTISYEVLCGISPRIPRIYIKGE